ncbi:hypothetical protein QEH42_gp202 [Microbacterium phage Pumpernickel]|uniref:Uncharacterized protein n=1 Tax=Microbacterium phage Pumpernickel TaxID=2885983 RepID=A0AAE9C3J2_9CAUD|nr:hypothetical protein QEH42_gp202 [Microbacterium phage Pumpernickel]UDL16016.1 hypothetical protein SEA_PUMPERNICKEL_266 [Microbacterium phage Pumpernickel]
MTDHNHVTQRASLPGDCPACDVVWFAVEVMDPLIDFKTEFQVALTLDSDYGPREMHHHLTRVMTNAQKLLHMNKYPTGPEKGAIHEWLSTRKS